MGIEILAKKSRVKTVLVSKKNHFNGPNTIFHFFQFGDDDGPNLCRVNKVDVSSTFIENIFRSGLTLVSSNDKITIKIEKK